MRVRSKTGGGDFGYPVARRHAVTHTTCGPGPPVQPQARSVRIGLFRFEREALADNGQGRCHCESPLGCISTDRLSSMRGRDPNRAPRPHAAP